jgi:hypothetical protein
MAFYVSSWINGGYESWGGKMSSILSIRETFTTKGVVLGTAAMLAIACLSPQESDFDLRFRTFAAIVVGTLVAFGTSLH